MTLCRLADFVAASAIVGYATVFAGLVVRGLLSLREEDEP